MRALLLALVVLAPAAAATLPLSGHADDAHWVAFRLDGSGDLRLQFRFANDADPAGYGRARFDGDGALEDVWTGVKNGAVLDVGAQTPATGRVSAAFGGGGLNIHSGTRVDGPQTLLIWTAGDVLQWEWEVTHVDPTVQLLDVEVGEGTHLLTARDFDGFGASAQGTFAGLRANALGTAAVSVERGLVGDAWSWGQDDLVRAGPDGTQTCNFRTVNAGILAYGQGTYPCEYAVDGPGTHAFTHTGVAYGILNLDELSVVMADYAP